MEYKEYGAKNNDIIVLLHGGGLSWWNYIDEIGLLKDDFHLVIPILEVMQILLLLKTML